MKKIKTVLLSAFPIPYEGIASWPKMFEYYLRKNNHKIDYIISPYVKNPIPGVHYLSVKKPGFLSNKLSRLWKYHKYRNYWGHLKKIIELEKKVIVQIIDNLGLLYAIDYFSKSNGLRNRFKIIYFMHGYDYNLLPGEREKFYSMVDDLVVLTRASYKFQLSKTHSMPCEVTHIYNGIDSKKFYKPSEIEKKKIRTKLNLDENKLYFLWLSQDRPKKGLHIILRAWNELIKKISDVELLIIGTKNKIEGEGITWLGRIPNSKLPIYYQASDFFLFSTLCHEGHPLSLTEALKSGCICIASDIDPMREILNNGKYGRLVDFPHNPENWYKAIIEEIKKYEQNNRINPYASQIPDKVYDIDIWCDNINNLINKWETRMLKALSE